MKKVVKIICLLLCCVSGCLIVSTETAFGTISYIAPSITINANANPSCVGVSVTYTSHVTNGGNAPAYQWRVNGNNISGATASSCSYIPSNNDQITCIVISNEPYVFPVVDTSNIINQTVNPATSVSSSITASVYAVMPSTSVTYTAAVVNGGFSPSYQWKVNNVNVGTNSSTYTYAPADHDKIVCVVSSSLSGCLSNNPATSNQVVAVVYTTGTPCSGTPTVTYAGHTYNTIQIGTQCWLRENLNVGTRINGGVEQTNNSVIEKWCYNNDTNNCAVYGGLYQWAEVVQYINGTTNMTNWNPAPVGHIQGICPSGWHVAKDAEWSTLITYLGGTTQTGGKIKESTTAHFIAPNSSASNSSGFTALPGGCYQLYCGFYAITMDFLGWLANNAGTGDDAYYFGAMYASSNGLTGQFKKREGLSVRCIKD